jgi:hypothetical protein
MTQLRHRSRSKSAQRAARDLLVPFRQSNSWSRSSVLGAPHLPDADLGGATCPSVEREISRFPCKERPHVPGSATTPDRPGTRDDARRPSCLPSSEQRRHPCLNSYQGSMAGLCAPLPTLRPCSREDARTARGRCGSHLLHRSGLPPHTPCRSPGALTVHLL